MKRQINADIHDLAHMVERARRWFKLARKIFDRAEIWFNDIDKKLQEIMLREAKRTRKDDTRRD